MSRYQVRAYFADKYSLVQGKPEEYVYLNKGVRNKDQALRSAVESYEQLLQAKGYLVYNYTRVVLWDTKEDEQLDEWLFDINYVTQESAERVLNGIIDETYPAVQVAEGTYSTSAILKAVDPVVYYETLNSLVTAQNSAIV